MDGRPPFDPSRSGEPAQDDLLEALLFWRAVYPLRGPDDSVSVIGVERAMAIASHRFEVLEIRDAYLDAARRSIRGGGV